MWLSCPASRVGGGRSDAQLQETLADVAADIVGRIGGLASGFGVPVLNRNGAPGSAEKGRGDDACPG